MFGPKATITGPAKGQSGLVALLGHFGYIGKE
jgi:hypothetical protein